MADETKKPDEEAAEKATPAPEKRRKEPTSEILQNFSRVTPAQLAHISFHSDARFQPVRSFTSPSTSGKSRPRGGGKALSERSTVGGGIIMLLDRTPGETTKFVDLPPELGGDEPTPMAIDQPAQEVEEAPMPEPFEVCTYFLLQ